MQNITFNGNNYVLFQDSWRSCWLFVATTDKQVLLWKLKTKEGWTDSGKFSGKTIRETEEQCFNLVHERQGPTTNGDSFTCVPSWPKICTFTFRDKVPSASQSAITDFKQSICSLAIKTKTARLEISRDTNKGSASLRLVCKKSILCQ